MNRSVRFLIALVACALTLSLSSAADDSGSKRVTAVSDAIKKFIDEKEVAGVVTLVANKDGILHLDAAGLADIADNKPMRPDSIIWIASMTKPITGTAVLMLEGEGKLSVDDPVEKYIPELAALKTADGQPAKVTIQHLLTHTSGMGEITPRASPRVQDAGRCHPAVCREAAPVQARREVGLLPVEHQHRRADRGDRFRQVVHRVPRRATVPSARDEGHDVLPARGAASAAGHILSAHRRRASWSRTENFILMGKTPTSRDRFPAANGGLFSTAPDYAQFCRMILNGGELDGHRYISRESLAKLTSVQTDDLKTGFTDGNGWGLGWCVIREPQGPTEALAPARSATAARTALRPGSIPRTSGSTS